MCAHIGRELLADRGRVRRRLRRRALEHGAVGGEREGVVEKRKGNDQVRERRGKVAGESS
jgi:hypothetical protein